MASDLKPLQDYQDKRDFTLTPEPDAHPVSAKSKKHLSFVVQKHAARALHYDFRLELDGTLKSWAVPKGPSLDPTQKRMAVHVEDHPLAYGGFEGEIPAGQYGAGSVIVWDRGEWVPVGNARAGYKNGKLKFELRGEKLRGYWVLVRMRRGDEKRESWLLIKERDEAARCAADLDITTELPDSVLKTKSKRKTQSKQKTQRTPQPLTLSPQLATLIDEVPRMGQWLWELKFDGYRLLARVSKNRVRLFTRNGHDWSAKLPHLVQAIEKLKLGTAWLDGEIVVPDRHGTPDFQALQNAFDKSATRAVIYYLFDLLFHDGEDLRPLPLQQRRERLKSILQAATQTTLRFSEDFSVAPSTLLHTACRMHMEGLIGKNAQAPYRSGRSTDWVKLKCTQRQEFIIVGYTAPRGQRISLGALLLAVHDDKGALRYAGRVGTGFSTQALSSLQKKLESRRVARAPIKTIPTEAKAAKPQWVKPQLVAEISFAQWTRQGLVRQAVFHGLRNDKPPRQIRREKPTRVKKKAKTSTAIKITHPERVIDAESGITKQELVEYYARAAEHILPHLKGRPVSLLRGPEGVQGELFFQKHDKGLRIPGMKLLDPSFDPDHAALIEIPHRNALLGAAQMNVIEFHTWNATTRAIEKPDRMTFDLDPGSGVRWAQVQEAAQAVHVLLQELDLPAFLKTSGGKGLHVVVPIRPMLGWVAVKALSQTIVQHLARALPQRFVSKSGPKNRVGKIFIDYLRNGRGATTACAWSVRARPGMGVSVPVDWSELPQLNSGAHWTLRTIDARLRVKDAWEAWPSSARQRPTLSAAMRALDFVVPKT